MQRCVTHNSAIAFVTPFSHIHYCKKIQQHTHTNHPPPPHTHTCLYHMAGNIGGKFNLVVWRMSGQSTKLKFAKHSAHWDFDDLVLHTRQIKIRQSFKKWGNDESAKYYSHQYFWPYGMSPSERAAMAVSSSSLREKGCCRMRLVTMSRRAEQSGRGM